MAQDWNAFVSGTTVFSDNFFNKLAQNLATLRTMFSGTSAPGSPSTYQIWLDTSAATPRLKVYDGAAWQDITDYFYDFVLAQAEIVEARGSASSLDARLDVAMNEDGTLKTTTTSSTWVEELNTVAYASASSFTVTGADVTAVYTTGRAVKLTQTSDDYAYVASSSFGGGNTTVNVYGGTVDSGLSLVEYSDQPEAMPYGEAGTTNKGVSERATDAEAKALTDTERHVTPGNMAAVISDHGSWPGFKNLVINGCCRVAQRSAAAPVTNTLVYGQVDRLGIYVEGTVGAGSITQYGGRAAGLLADGVQVSGLTLSGGGEKVHCITRIESRDAVRMKNKTASVRCKVYQNTGSAVNGYIALYKPAAAEDIFSSVTQIAISDAVSIPSGVWTDITFQGVSMGECMYGVQVNVRLDVGAITTKTVIFSQLQIEMGTVCTDFELRPFAQELAMCQRYFQRMGGKVASQAYFPGAAWSTNLCIMQYRYAVEMRAAPTVSFSAVDDFVCAIAGGSYVTSNVTASAITSQTCQILATIAYSSTMGLVAAFQGDGTTDHHLDLSAEL